MVTVTDLFIICKKMRADFFDLRFIFEHRPTLNETAGTHIDSFKTQIAWLSGSRIVLRQKK